MPHVFKKLQYLIDSIVSKSNLSSHDELARLNHFLWMMFIALPLTSGFSVYHLLRNEHALVAVISTFLFLSVLNIFFIRQAKNVTPIYHFFNITIILFIFAMLFYSEDGTHILWAYLYPLVSIFLFGLSIGAFWSTVLILILGTSFFTCNYMGDFYSFAFKIRFIATYITIFSITAWMEYYRRRFAEEAYKNHSALLEEKERLDKEIERRIALEEKLRIQAQTDSLTNLLNRGHFWIRSTQEIERARRHHIPVCMAILDIDYFKTINDTYGHPMGDQALKTLADHCKYSLRNSDLIGRLGGEEFGILLLHTTEEEAMRKLDTLRNELEHMIITNAHYSFRLTVSIGVATLSKEVPTMDKLYTKADQALYEAKESGRNCIKSLNF